MYLAYLEHESKLKVFSRFDGEHEHYNITYLIYVHLCILNHNELKCIIMLQTKQF